MGIIIEQYKKTVLPRFQESKGVYYFTYKDFPSLKHEKHSVDSEGNLLKGYLYYYTNYKRNYLIVYAHGLGGGHHSDMHEIELLARNGYQVFAFDFTGFCESEGEDAISLSHSLVDLSNVIEYCKKNLSFKHLYLMGHSMGGYAVGNVANFVDGIEKVVMVSPFVSISSGVDGFLISKRGPLWNFIKKRIKKYETRINEKYYKSSLFDALLHENIKFFIAHSRDDSIVPYELNCKRLEEKCKGKNVTFYVVNGKNHNPNYSSSAVSYLGRVFSSLNDLTSSSETKNDKFKNVDWNKVTEQDEEFWNKVIAFLNEGEK